MIGTTIGPYQVLAKLGEGGMGEVYRARDTRLNRDVAIKVLPTFFAGDPDRRARFEREAQAVAALSHPNVIAIFDTGVHDHQLYVVMELLAGGTLRERLASGALSVRKAVDIAAQIARGLGAAHGKGLVHRDLKPENIFLLDDGQVKILDFGLARQAAEADQAGAAQTVAATDPGTVMGTVGYMAPEQVRGQAVDARADVFAFGAVLYEMVSGLRAFQRDTPADTMTAILTQEPPELPGSRPDLSPALDRIIRHCLEKNANERFQSARDVAFALEALSGPASGPAPSGAAPPAAVTVRRLRVSVLMTAAVAGALLLGATAGYLGRGPGARTSATVGEITYEPVTFEEGFIFTARFAPDGRTIVYSADWDRQPRGVYVTSVDSAEYRPLGFPGADLLAISPSGELAILNGSTVTAGQPYWRIGTLARASITGGAPRAELEGVRFADFGPGNTWAVVRDDTRRRTMEYPVGQVLAGMPIVKNQSLIWVGGGGGGHFATPRVSPSGDHVAFFDTRVPSAFKVKVFDRSGKFVTESGTFDDWWALAWTPSNEVWFATTEDSGSQTIFGLDLAGHQRTVFRAMASMTLHDISKAGDVLASFDHGKPRIEIIDGSNPAPQDRSWRDGGYLSGFSNTHALLTNRFGGTGGPQKSVYVWLPTEAQPVRIAGGVGMGISPDGSKALVVSNQSPPTISMVPTGAGQPQIIDLGVVDLVSWAGWLPDGRLVIEVVRPGSGPVAYVLSAAGRGPVKVLPAGVTLHGGNLISPDGSRVIAVDAAGQFVVCTIATPGCRPVAGTHDGDVMSGWAADNQSVFVYQPTPDQVLVERLDVVSGRRSAWKTIRPLSAAVSGLTTLIASPDGALAYVYRADASQLYVIKGLK
jgi:eukaryotic-like serine/threonine-protein kinase